MAGVAFQNTGWATNQTDLFTDIYSTGLSTTPISPYSWWVMSTDQPGLYRANKVDRTQGTGTSFAPNTQWSINNGADKGASGSSPFASAAVLLYDRKLSLSEIVQVGSLFALLLSHSSIVL